MEMTFSQEILFLESVLFFVVVIYGFWKMGPLRAGEKSWDVS